jgi:dimethylargininase
MGYGQITAQLRTAMKVLMRTILPIRELTASPRKGVPSKSRIAIIRRVPDTLDKCGLEFRSRQSINVVQARAQQSNYVKTLKRFGFQAVTLAGDNRYPDCCYVEDTAIVTESVAVIMSLGSRTRKGEEERIEKWLRRHMPRVYKVVPPARIEGGDVLFAGRRVFVGLSTRTNWLGYLALKWILEREGYAVRSVRVRGALHLKTACTYLGGNVLLGVKQYLPGSNRWARDFKIIDVPARMIGGVNTLSLDGRVLMSRGYPEVARKIEEAGFRLEYADISEHERAEAGLTCLSILLNPNTRT